MSSPKMNEKPPRSHSLSRRSNKILSPTNSKEQIADDDSSTAQHVERVKSERAANSATKQDEDRRRRTIIVEKKNGTYGFTLQSYGIHYKKEQEIEMITYVDYVEYDGPAYKAGMREGDVILSINGQNMEKADHKALVNFIKNCDSRMRMVVLFEDCVRKVELHIRYIQLQRILQTKTAELDMLCLKEREVLQGKWKSHSLPARKKASSVPHADIIGSCQDEPYCRPTVSIEDVARVPSQPQILLAYQCSRYPCAIQSNNSNECLVGWNRENGISTPVLLKANGESKQNHINSKGYHHTNGAITTDGLKGRGNNKKPKHFQHQTRHLCNPCMQAINNQDNTSLEAYDLASPCCDPQCVPSARRKFKQQNHRHGHQGKCQEHDTCKENIKCGSSQKVIKGRDCGEEVHKSNANKSHKYLSSLVSQFSLHSCTSSDVSQGPGESSGISYTTSLSSDTLYWDGNESKPQAKQHSHCRTSICKSHSTCDNYHTFQPVKPKSWDNLTTKAFGGYGFGYGYMDAGISSKNNPYTSSSATSYLNNASGNTMPLLCKVKNQPKTNAVINLNQINFKSKTGGRVHSIKIYHNGHRIHDQPVKSTENLLLLKKSNSAMANSSLSCECLEIGSPIGEKTSRQFFPAHSAQAEYFHRDAAENQSHAKPRRSSIKQTGNVSRL